MRRNSLMDTASADRHKDDAKCCRDNYCKVCGSHVSGYNANSATIAARPEAAREDWWIACDNADCAHSYGEGLFQELPDWVTKKRQGEV